MPLLPYSYKRVDEHLRVKVSNHFFYSAFGVSDGGDMTLGGRRFVCSGTPGTGFFERDSESHAYHSFVQSHASVRSSRWIDMVLGREPSFQREMNRVAEVLRGSGIDPRQRELLECYSNALPLAKGEELLERGIQGVKEKMGHRHSKQLVSIIGRYKNKIAQLKKDMDGVVYHVEDHYSPEVLEAYGAVCDAFNAMAHRCRRIWHYDRNSRRKFRPVFFDMGVFDYIRHGKALPLMRDSRGVSYYFLPDSLLVARSSVDFDLVPLKSLALVWQEMALEEPIDLLSRHMIDAACMVQMPSLDITFYFNHVRVVLEFVQSVDHLKTLL